jgi:hypothetical protein
MTNFAEDCISSPDLENLSWAMPRSILIARPKRLPLSTHQAVRVKVVLRTIKRGYVPSLAARPLTESDLSPPSLGFQPDPYLDYGRYLTDEGGVLFVYKDLDLRFRQTVWRVFAWTLFTSLETRYLAPYSPLENHWTNIALLLAIAAINFLIVSKSVEVYRRIEIRPDCMIMEGVDVFWARHMDGGAPAFRPDAEGNQALCGIYGTRFIEYLTVRRFDDNDRMTEVLAAHLGEAMQQQWSRPH